MILQGKDSQECNTNIKETATLFLKLGFNIHLEKSVLVPTQELNFLGFTINSHTMTVTLPLEKKTKLKDLCLQVLGYSRPKIRLVAKLIGKFVSSLPGVDFGKLHYRNLERDKIWNWCITRNIWLTAIHIPGIHNVQYDALSRKGHSDHEWMLNKQLFDKFYTNKTYVYHRFICIHP